jgi:hypothetical protein
MHHRRALSIDRHRASGVLTSRQKRITATLIVSLACAGLAPASALGAIPAIGAGIVIPRAGKGRIERSSFPRVAGAVYAAAPDGRGGWYIGGSFDRVGGVARRNLAHLTAGGGVDAAFDPASDGEVDRLAVSGGTIYAIGDFTSIGGRPRQELAALDAGSGRATTWDPEPTGPDLYLNALATSGSTVYVGGNFTAIGGQSRRDLAALDAVTGQATAWNPSPDNVVFALAVAGPNVYVGGEFTTIGGRSRNGLAAIDASGRATSWDPNPAGDNAYVDPIAVAGSTVYVGGGFSSIGGRHRRHLAALDATTGRATSWNPRPNDVVFALAVSGSSVYAGGQFSAIGGAPRHDVAALDARTGRARRWNPGLLRPCAPGDPHPCARVHTLAVSRSAVYVGEERGDLRGLRATSTSRLSRGRIVRLRVSCPVSAPSCTGKVKLHTLTRLNGRRHTFRSRAARTVRGHRLRLRLTRHAVRLIRGSSHHRIRMSAHIVVRSRGGAVSVAKERFTLVVPHARRLRRLSRS